VEEAEQGSGTEGRPTWLEHRVERKMAEPEKGMSRDWREGRVQPGLAAHTVRKGVVFIQLQWED
jgi:hypothetical protein